jgi:hypothetical protein
MKPTHKQLSLFSEYSEENITDATRAIYMKSHDDPTFNIQVELDDEESTPAECALRQLGYFLIAN